MVLTIIQSSVTLFEILCVIIVFAFIFMRSRFFHEVFEHHPSWTTQILLMVFFGILSIFGTLSGLSIYGAVVNIRDLGPMAAGLVCGPYIGIGSGIIGGLLRFAQGGPYMWTGLSAPILSGILGGIMYLANKRQFVPTWIAVLYIGLSETLISCYTLILVTKPSEFFTVVTTVAIPMVVFNVIGMFIFATVVRTILDERTAQKKMQLLELEVESKRNLNTIINTISYPVYVIDRDHRFNLVNDSFCHFIGHGQDEILGKTIRDFFDEPDSRFHGKMTEQVFLTKSQREDEVTITKPDGQKCTIISTSALYTDATHQEFLVGVIQDISERKKMEVAIKESETWYRSLFEHTGAATIIINEDTTIDQANSEFAELTGYSRKEIEGKMSWTNFCTPEFLPILKKYHTERRTGLSSVPTSYGLKVQDRSGIIKDVHAIVTLIPGTMKTIASFVDITERMKAEDALRRANRQLNLLSGITRHDILNNITIILGFLAIMEKKFPDSAHRDLLSKMKTATKEIQSQIEFTRVYKNLGSQEPQWQDLDAIISGLHLPSSVTLNAMVRGVEVFADPMLEKVFFNLLDNSIRHGQQVTAIGLSASQSDEGLMIDWVDNGIGIPADEKEKIFERGFGKNTGLGMFLVREILSISGITIKETGTEGQGARFEIFVPKGAYRISDIR